jgi:hypothetical protein
MTEMLEFKNLNKKMYFVNSDIGIWNLFGAWNLVVGICVQG